MSNFSLPLNMDWPIGIVVVAAVVAMVAFKLATFISAEKARRLLHEGALVVDVRSPEEFRSRHVPGALNIPLNEFRETLPSRVTDRNQVLLLHCLSGGRSGMARGIARRMGYDNAFNLGSYGRAERIVASAHD
jgi:phage shock protein E